MNILWLSHLIPYPPKAGVLLRSYNLLRQLAKRHNVKLLAFNQHALMQSFYTSSFEGIEEARKELKSFCAAVEFFEIPIEKHRFGKHCLAVKSLFTHDCYTINWLKSGELMRRLRDISASESFDLIHFDTISLAPYRTFFPNTPLVLDHHNIESHMLLRRAMQEKHVIEKLYFWQEGKRLSRYEKAVCKDFDLHITCSDLDSQRLIAIDESLTVTTIENGADLAFFQPTHPETESLSMIFVGTMNWYPNIDAVRFVIKNVWPQLIQRLPDIRFDIIGANPPKELVELARQESRICFHGFVDDIRPWLSNATVYICPIRDGGGTKLKILDALAMEKAIVCHPIACEGLKVTDGHDVVFAETSTDFAEQILKIVEDRRLRVSLGKNGRKLIEQRYSFDAIGQRLINEYERLISAHKHR